MYLSSNKVEHYPAMTYHPQINWLLEHLAGTLEIMPRQAQGDQPVSHGDEPFNKFVFACHTMVQETISEIPFF